MMKMGVFIMAALTLSAPANANANSDDKFSLDCRGTSSAYKDGKKAEGSFARSIRVDLVKGEYCLDKCELVSRIAETNSLEITFVNRAYQRGSFSHFKDFARVNRRTGDYEVAYMNSDKLEFMTARAVCSPASFIPFPQTKF